MSGEPPSIWRERMLVGFMAAALVSNIGNWMQIFSEQWFTLLLSGPEAARWGGRLGFASGLAILVFVPLGGVVADRVDRRRALALVQVWLMGSALTMGLLAWRHRLGLRGLLMFALVSGLGSALSMPLAHSLIGDLVPQARIPEAMGVMSVQFNLSRIIGPTVAALMFPLVGAAGNFMLNAATFLPMVWACLRLRPAEAPKPRATEPSYREGLAAFRDDPDLRRLLLLAAVAGLFAWCYFPLLPVYGARNLGLTGRGVAGLLSAFGAGAVLGALGVAGNRGGADKRGRMLGAYAGFGLGLGSLSVLSNPWGAAAVFFGMGLVQATFIALMSGFVQQGVPVALRGRANGIYLTAVIGITPLGTLLAGETAQALGANGPRWVMGVNGLVLLATALFVHRRIPKPHGP